MFVAAVGCGASAVLMYEQMCRMAAAGPSSVRTTASTARLPEKYTLEFVVAFLMQQEEDTVCWVATETASVLR